MKTAVLLVVALAFAQQSSGTPLLGGLGNLIKGVADIVDKVLVTVDAVVANLLKVVLGAVSNILEGIVQNLKNGLLTLEEAKSQLVQELETYLKKVEGITQPIIDAIIKEVHELLATVKEIPDLIEAVPKIKALIEKHLSEPAATASEAPNDAAVSR